MKKALSFAVALGLVGGMASAAVASDMLDFHGTARVRAVRQNTSQGTVQAKAQNYDERVRFQMNAKVTDNVTVKTRMTLLDKKLGMADTTNANLDRANIVIKDQPITGGTWSYGRMDTSNTKFFSWAGSADRIKAVYGLGDGSKVGGFIEKGNEALDLSTDGDTDTYAAFYVGKFGDTKLKTTAYYIDNDAGDLQDNMLDIKVNTKAGPANLTVELGYKAGDTKDNLDGGAQVGFHTLATMAVSDTVTAAGIIAYAKGDYEATAWYTPSLLIGRSQVTGITNFGESQASVVGDEDSAYLIAAAGIVKLSDAATLVGAAGFYSQADVALGADGTGGFSITELDVSLMYNMAKNTNFKVGLAYGMPDNWSADDDNIYSAGWQITTKW